MVVYVWTFWDHNGPLRWQSARSYFQFVLFSQIQIPTILLSQKLHVCTKQTVRNIRSWRGSGLENTRCRLCHVIFPRDSFCLTWPVASVRGWVPPASAIAWNTKNHSRLAYLVICNGLLLSNALCCHVGTALGHSCVPPCSSAPPSGRKVICPSRFIGSIIIRLFKRNNHIFGPVLSEVTFIFTNLV